MKWICPPALIFLFIFSSNALAHDWFLVESDIGFDIVMGHVEATGVEGDPYEPERAIQAAGYRDNGDAAPITVSWKMNKEGSYLSPSEKFSAITALVYNKYWMKTTDGWKNDKVRGDFSVLQAGQSYKYMKHIHAWKGFMLKPLGQRFEIVPVKDPLSAREGEILPIKLFFMGKEIKQAKITRKSRTHELDAVSTEGHFEIVIGKKGLQFINAKIEIPVSEKEVIWYAASLTFNTSM
jgi:hypothetical protein